MSARRPSDEQFNIACDWLDHNEGEGEEGEACRTVAAWLRDGMIEALFRREARREGVPVARLRAVIAAQRAERAPK